MVSSHGGTLSVKGSVGLWKMEQASGKAVVGYLEGAQNLGRRSGFEFWLHHFLSSDLKQGT